jgi:hypothetical protein
MVSCMPVRGNIAQFRRCERTRSSAHSLNAALPGIARLLPLTPLGKDAHSSHPFSPALCKNS